MRVAVAQLCSTSSVTRNLTICRRIIERAANAGAKLVYLPEASDYIAPTFEVYTLSTHLHQSPFVDGIREQARKSSVWVGVGVHERLDKEERVNNTQLLIDDGGEIKGKYDKMHLFDVDLKGSGGPTVLESKTTRPGTRLVSPISTPVGKVGLLTCYDLRFPESSLLLRQKGAELITYPSAFTLKTGKAHWEILLRARATETQSYVLAPAQVGEHFQGRSSYGRAMIIDPWGSVMVECPPVSVKHTSHEEEEVGEDEVQGRGEGDGDFVVADIDLEWLARVRREMPLWNQRRSDIYQLKEEA